MKTHFKYQGTVAAIAPPGRRGRCDTSRRPGSAETAEVKVRAVAAVLGKRTT